MFNAATLIFMRTGAVAALVLAAFLVAGAAMAAAGQNAVCDAGSFVVAVDAGHGPKRSGAQSARGVPEYAFNRNMAERIVEELRLRGFSKAFLVDKEGKDLSLAERPNRANAKNADVFLSVHHDSAQPQYFKKWVYQGKTRRYSDRFSGHSLFVSMKNPQAKKSLELARLIGQALRREGLSPTMHHAEKIKGENREFLDRENGVYRYDGLVVLSKARMPAVLLECGVIVNRDEETALTDPVRQMRIATAVADAVAAFCRESAKK